MIESILNTIKKMLNVSLDETGFDEDILVGINTAFMKLHQIGIGTENVFSVNDPAAKWTDFLGVDLAHYAAVKSYIYLLVREIFDPPTNPAIITAYKNQSEELLWRLSAQIPPEEVV